MKNPGNMGPRVLRVPSSRRESSSLWAAEQWHNQGVVDFADMWTCPRCGKRFVNPSQWHSCGPHGVDDFLETKGPRAVALWQQLQEMVERCGPADVHAAATRIGFMVRTRFLSVTALSDRGMTFTLWLKEEVASPRFSSVQHLGGRDWLHSLRVTSASDLDDEVQRWVCMSYRVGCQSE